MDSRAPTHVGTVACVRCLHKRQALEAGGVVFTREWDRATRAAVAAETIVVSVAKREDVNPTATAMVVEGDGGGFED